MPVQYGSAREASQPRNPQGKVVNGGEEAHRCPSRPRRSLVVHLVENKSIQPAQQRERLETQIGNMTCQETDLGRFQRPFIWRHFSLDGNEEPDPAQSLGEVDRLCKQQQALWFSPTSEFSKHSIQLANQVMQDHVSPNHVEGLWR